MTKKTLFPSHHLPAKRLITSVILCLISSQAYSSFNEQITEVQTEITRQEQEIKNKNKKLDTLQAQLKTQEKSINVLSRKIRNIYSNLSILKDEISALKKENNALQQQKNEQMVFLENLMLSQYRQGKHASLSAILGADSNANYDRMTIYVERLSKERTEMINKLTKIDQTLKEKHQRLQQQTERQKSLLNELKQDKAQLETKQKSRQQTSRAIQKQIRTGRTYLSELQDNKNRLQQELKQAQEQAKIAAAQEKARLEALAQEQAQEEAQKQQIAQHKTVRMNGLRPYRGKLQWPVKGEILHSYGSQQTGQLRWNGIVISAKEGTEVKATHDGTVVLSNWLRGYGLMVVIDHGKGDMSFYGYNQVLLRNVGDRVKAGEPIALVGNSGGQASSGLYFEIRRKGNATNPKPWLKK